MLSRKLLVFISQSYHSQHLHHPMAALLCYAGYVLPDYQHCLYCSPLFHCRPLHLSHCLMLRCLPCHLVSAEHSVLQWCCFCNRSEARCEEPNPVRVVTSFFDTCSSMNTYVIYRVGHKKVARLLFCTCPCYCINFCIYAMLRTRVALSWPTLRVGHEKEINTVARTRAKWKVSYFIVAHPVYSMDPKIRSNWQEDVE